MQNLEIYAEKDGVTLFENTDGIFIYPPDASEDIARALVLAAFDQSNSRGGEEETNPEDIIPESIKIVPLLTRTETPAGMANARRISWMTVEDKDLEDTDRITGLDW